MFLGHQNYWVVLIKINKRKYYINKEQNEKGMFMKGSVDCFIFHNNIYSFICTILLNLLLKEIVFPNI